MILSDRDIRAQIEAGRVVIEPFDPACVQPSSVDLHVDSQFRVFANNRYPFIDVREEQPDLTELVEMKPDEPFILHPGEFVLGSTLERVALPDDLVARLEGKSSLGRLGLLIHSTAGYVDPGWDGYLTLELSNVANLPITLYPGMKIGQISFFRLTSPAETPYGAAGNKYQGQRGPTPSRFYRDFGLSRPRAQSVTSAPGIGPTPICTAIIAACVRFVTPSLRKIAARWALTVFSDRNRRPRDLAVRTALGEQREDVVLALGQAVLVAPAPVRAVAGVRRSWSSNRFWITRGLSTLPLPDIATLIACARSSGVASFSR